MAFNQLENNLHWVLDVTFGEDLSRVNLDSLPCIAYAEVLRRDTGQSVEPAKLVAPMLARFMTTDRAFLRARREKQTTR